MYLTAKLTVEWIGSTFQVAAGSCCWIAVVILRSPGSGLGFRTEVHLPFVSKGSAPDRSPQEEPDCGPTIAAALSGGAQIASGAACSPRSSSPTAGRSPCA